MGIHLVLADDDRPPIPEHYTIGTDQVARIYLGDDEYGLIYSIVVCFSPLPGYEDLNGHELSFFIQQCAPDGTELHTYHDGSVTRHILDSREKRRVVLGAMISCVEALIVKFAPSICHMFTYEPNQPKSALRKFHKIVGIFEDHGYDCAESDPHYGRYTWRMQAPEG